MATPPPATALDVIPASRAISRTPDIAWEHAFYPWSDGEPMAENQWQSRAMHAAVSDLETAHPDAWVAEDILVYPEQGNRENSIAPDVLVVFGVATHTRPFYMVWREGKPPDWVLEVASPRTFRRDLTVKREAYAAMGVPEYWLFDPKGDLYPSDEPQLQGQVLSGGVYRPLPSRIEGGQRVIRSEVLKLDLRVEGELIRFRDPATGRDIRHRVETEAGFERAEVKAAQAEAALERETARANAEANQRATAEARVEEAEARAEEAEARMAEMAATIERLRSGEGTAR